LCWMLTRTNFPLCCRLSLSWSKRLPIYPHALSCALGDDPSIERQAKGYALCVPIGVTLIVNFHPESN